MFHSALKIKPGSAAWYRFLGYRMAADQQRSGTGDASIVISYILGGRSMEAQAKAAGVRW